MPANVPPRPAAARSGSAGRTLAYEPALDGIRAIAVVAVLLFHGEVSWVKGGFLGVSTFFTLSGFLITTLLLREHERRSSIDLAHFWGRRFRRLMPAALVCLMGVVVFGATVATANQLVDLRAGILASLAYVANWWLIVAGQSYAELFVAPSPVQHFWSLAIEEQFYVVFPLLVAGVLLVGKGSRRTLGLVLAGLTAASLLWTVVLTVGFDVIRDRVYYGTDTRAAELLLGGLLAVAVARRGSWVVEGAAGRRVQAAGVVALVVSLVLWATTSITAGWLYVGGLGPYAVVSGVLVLAALQPAGPVRRLLAVKPLVLIGLVSYGAYLYHWPLYLWLTEARTGLDGPALLALRLAATAAAATASYLLIEKPIRTRRVLRGLGPWIAAPIAASIVAVGAIAVTADPPTDEVIDLAGADDLSEQVDPIGGTGDPLEGLGENVVDKDPGAVRIAFYGDSTALTLAVGANQWINEQSNAARAGGETPLGCGIGRGGEREYLDGPSPTPDDCWSQEWAQSVAENQPDLAVVLAGAWDLTDRIIPGDDHWRSLGDPVYDQYLLGEMEAAAQVLIDGGAEVVWLTTPRLNVGQVDGEPPDEQHPASEPGRAERMNQLVAELAARHPEDIHVVDLRGYLQSLPGGEMDPEIRPDAVHFTVGASEELTADWLGPALLDLWAQVRETPPVTAPPPTSVPVPAG